MELELGCPFEHSKIVPSQKLRVIDKVSSQSQNPELKLEKLRSRALSSLNFVFTPLNLIQQIPRTNKNKIKNRKKKKCRLSVTSLQIQTKKHQTPLPSYKTTTTTTNVSLCLCKTHSLSLSSWTVQLDPGATNFWFS